MSGASQTAWQTPRLPGRAPDLTAWSVVPFLDLDEALAAIDENRSGRPLLLVPPPGAAGYLGLGWFHGLKEQISGRAEFVVDCGFDAALAFEALRQGFTHVAFTGNEDYFEELIAFTDQQGAVLYRTSPAAEC